VTAKEGGQLKRGDSLRRESHQGGRTAKEGGPLRREDS